MSNKAKIREDAMKLNPIDDALFAKMAEDINFCQEILQVFLADKKLMVLDSNPQYMVKNLQGRSCILDLKCSIGSGEIVHVEVQKSDDDDHQKRVRYNASLLTTNIANPGDKFCNIPDIVSIFISRFDVFKSGRAAYNVERIVKETGKIVYNGIREVYINAENYDKSDIADLMKVFVEDDVYEDKKFPVTSERKRRFKTTEEGVKEMCEIIERNRAEAYAEGVARGETRGEIRGTIKTLINLVKKNRITIEEAAEDANMTVKAFEAEMAAL